jgi:hypothetical protein
VKLMRDGVANCLLLLFLRIRSWALLQTVGGKTFITKSDQNLRNAHIAICSILRSLIVLTSTDCSLPSTVRQMRLYPVW